MVNPFTEKYITDTTDTDLIDSALSGNKKALEELVLRHQAWIYNVALRMVFYPQEAEDVTQEILIKMITKLSGFRKESSFRTWLYRIVVNHVLNMKKSLGEKNHASSFDDYAKAIDRTPDGLLTGETCQNVEMKILVDEVKISCMTGMLLCLDREQRLVYILGVIFQVTDRIGAEILDISRDNFRQKLSRARKDIVNFMHQKCGLIDKKNPCRCEKKTKALIDVGYVNPKNLLFHKNYIYQIESVVQDKQERFDKLFDEDCAVHFREQPFQNPPDFVIYINKLLDNKEFKNIFNFTN
jgi:RNA polymerase sigma factor (sigma-70 family)